MAGAAPKFTIAFKVPELEDQLFRADVRLQPVIRAAAEYLSERGKTLTITCVFRDAETQARYRAEAIRLGRQEPVKSPHEDGRAVDIRTRDLDAATIKSLVTKLNREFPYAPFGSPAARYPTALYHDVGQGAHIHIQVRPPFRPPERH
ncbi:MAG: hypothetical protein KIT79_12675 [Deltaproteobacteria bacterium]|nr:hypothetical protein [Deltaproteobacteria bacterium]